MPQKRPLGFQSTLGSIESEGVSVGGDNSKPGMRLTSQDVEQNGRKVGAFSAVNADLSHSFPDDQNIHMDEKDFVSYAEEGEGDVPFEDEMRSDDWLRIAQESFFAADSAYNSKIKPKLIDNIRAFNSQHKTNSLYTKSPEGWTSKLYKPKTRAILNKYQASACVALFSNQDIIEIEPENAYDPQEIVAVSVHKALLQYRLRRTIPWYKLSLGAFQDAMVQGTVVGHVGWDSAADKPTVQVLPLDHVRFDPECDWVDPVNSSPYFIVLRDMTIGEFKENVKKGFFFDISDSLLLQAVGGGEQSVQDQRDQDKGSGVTLNSYSVYNRIQIQEHIHKRDGKDIIFYTLGTIARVSDVVPLKDVYYHGKRPYVVGTAEIESHRVFAAGFPDMVSGLQEEANELTNQRLNVIKLKNNPKFLYRKDAVVNLQALLRNQPGTAVGVEDLETDVKEMAYQPMDQMGFLETQSIDHDFDELGGNFDATKVDLNNRSNDNGRALMLQSGQVNTLLEYRIRTFVETWITPMLDLLDKTESRYETNPKLLEMIARQVGIVKTDPVAQQVMGGQGQAPGAAPQAPSADPMSAGNPQAQGQPSPEKNPMPKEPDFTPMHLVYMRYLLTRQLNINANVGMSATDPMMKLQRFLSGTQAIKQQFPALRLDSNEFIKEVYALSGYTNGMRFVEQTVNPETAKWQQIAMQLSKKLQFHEATAAIKIDGAMKKEELKQYHEDMRAAAKIELDAKELHIDTLKYVHEHETAAQGQPQPGGASAPQGGPPQV